MSVGCVAERVGRALGPSIGWVWLAWIGLGWIGKFQLFIAWAGLRLVKL